MCAGFMARSTAHIKAALGKLGGCLFHFALDRFMPARSLDKMIILVTRNIGFDSSFNTKDQHCSFD